MATAAKEENRELAEAPVTGLLLKLAIPTVIAQLVNLLYNMVDRIYVGRIPEVGTEALAGGIGIGTVRYGRCITGSYRDGQRRA